MQALSHLMDFVPRAPLNTLQMGAKTDSSAAASSASNSVTSAATGIGSTFLNLLTQELQNQDPTAPMDSTAMVGQMISLNQLDQLISINQSLSQAQQSTTAATTPSGGTTQAVAGARNFAAAFAATPTAAAEQQLPFDPRTMMPLDVNHPGGALAPNIPGINAQTWNAPQTNMPLSMTGRK